ncbi:dipeptide ABC transporter ATP-binding protein [Agilicoccus flavus]|uniref:dipeptide ABC transporter ATP-binding protein n=1 Tax=Agilicoccus flavus TaxID=2775968 RepID=UPI001CF63D18|nr:ABC transporter ATP-binding protein [Agilicoccus flavus]
MSPAVRTVPGRDDRDRDDLVLDVAGLSVHAGDLPLVQDVALSVRRGERVGLIGESGSGKSLTALSVLGLLPTGLRASGRVRVATAQGPHDVVGSSERAMSAVRGRDVAMVFQEPMTALNPTMRVGRQVAEAMRLHGVDARAAGARAVELLADVRLPDPAAAARAYPHQLSGGQRQRVVLAMALANDPGLLVADEPTTALDVTVQAGVLDLIVAGVAARDAGLLFISHDLAVVATVCDRVAVMTDGRIVETGDVAQVLTAPDHPYTRRLVAAADLSVVDDRGRLTGGAGTRRPSAPPARASSGGSAAAPPEHDRPGDGSADWLGAPIIEVSGLSRTYAGRRTSWRARPEPVHALRDVSFTVARGERLGIVGESGCGKSTLLRLLAGLDTPTSGTVRIEGAQVSGRSERELVPLVRRRLQLVFQDPMGSLDPRMRVADIVAEPLVAQGLPGGRERVRELLTAVGLDPDAARRYSHQFSGGQRQRISIARALAPSPSILVADEAVSALDVSVRAQVLDLLADLVDDLGLTLVFVSHDLAVVRHLCERVLVMEAGRIVEEGPTAALFEAPDHPYTRRLVGSIPTIAGALRGDRPADLAAGAGSDADSDVTTDPSPARP